MPMTFATDRGDAIPLHVVETGALKDWLAGQLPRVATWVQTSGFKAELGQAAIIPAEDGSIAAAAVGYGDASARNRGRFHLAGAAAKLPAGTYKLVTDLDAGTLEPEVLGWLMAAYAFDRYAKASGIKARLVAPEGVDAGRIETIAEGEALTRDLINMPACDMGPVALEAACVDLAGKHGASIDVIRGEALIEQNFPMIHAVGRASDQAPRLIDMRWGDLGPKLTLVGKGVCFDTGGLNLKPGASMGLMKKDMGGAATVMGLAQMIMALGLRVQLRVLIPAVENAVSSNSFRPGDILTSRKGLTVEINNTDAEGRLVLADALAFASEETPDLMLSMATLTGAARVAVGPDLAPYYSDDDAMAAALDAAARKVADPVWRMPFWTPYEKMIEPGIADLDNAPSGGFAGSITAALFLRRFAGEATRYTHFDIYGWNPTAAPGRPKGGVGMGARAVLEALPGVLGL
ncbi:leucyl aminopeptidase family protein [Aquicoccus porphyridii]|uniref:Leucyl aminopeptidase family protein n=1 Tax=Aquicoccus porphyridii TaxID=1852029 RepID=A0A5A9ZK90_9RHOB|nr:leucyl aminopeptidase family protein [Aquicoccus porphyridii]KAA0917469.1 leucyl aminopeptidase family protein [Aquicoccus porphyridii]RAI55556.1 leucyl aminopeptidase family protein [Rhodobacteraceae bacterium AsT-22]